MCTAELSIWPNYLELPYLQFSNRMNDFFTKQTKQNQTLQKSSKHYQFKLPRLNNTQLTFCTPSVKKQSHRQGPPRLQNSRPSFPFGSPHTYVIFHRGTTHTHTHCSTSCIPLAHPHTSPQKARRGDRRE